MVEGAFISGSSESETARSSSFRCVLVEDEGMFLEMLGGMLQVRGGLEVVGTAKTALRGKRMCRKLRPDLLVVDWVLPDGNGLQVARHLLECQEGAKVILVTGHASEFVCPDWLDAALHAVVSKDASFQVLHEELAELVPLPTMEGRAVQAPAGTLSGRESEIFAMVGEGLTTRAIAARLGLSAHTVQTYRKRVARKLGTMGPEITYRAMRERSTADPVGRG
jgi:DNA-binding NarL/FixJ family response regulator